jgi:protein-L-isoaspartate(D-aspartate) O-methyltransferase
MGEQVDLKAGRRAYSAEIGLRAGIRSAALLQALAEVPREQFLGPGPWRVAGSGPGASANKCDTPDNDPIHVYKDVSVALDVTRNLYNGAPSILTAWIDALDLHDADRVFHLGGASGYYTAIMANVIGPLGRIVMVEIDKELGCFAQQALQDWPCVKVVVEDGASFDPGPCDAMLVNAGVTHPHPLWLNRLNDGGRLLVPLTMEFPNSNVGKGALLKIARQGKAFIAQFVPSAVPVMIYSCRSGRDPVLNQHLLRAFTTGFRKMGDVRSIRLDQHAADSSCWVHTETMCLSCERATAQ